RDSSILRAVGSYSIARWGTEAAAARGVPVVAFRHHDAHALHELLKRPFGRRRPVVVVDGFCPACGRPAPIAEYLDCVRPLGGVVIIDDTQALGIFGHSPGVQMPYGKGGGGSLMRAGIQDPRLVIVGSLAKAFGAPIAVLCGSEATVDTFEIHSGTRTHCSPPSAASIAAGR